MAELVPVKFNPFKSPSNPQEFAARYGSAAEKAGKALGVDPQVLLGQWGLETGWGKSVIPGTNNLGNIKDFSGSGTAATDNMTGSRDKYRTYESPDAFVDDFVSLVQRKYPKAVGAKDPLAFATALKEGGYAEDPRYVDKVVQATRMTKPMNPVMAAGKAITDAIIPSANAAEPQLVRVDFDPFKGAQAPAQQPPAPKGKREKTRVEKAINTVAKFSPFPIAAAIDAATGGEASIGVARGVKDVIDTGAGYLSRLGGAEEQARIQAMNEAGKQDFQQTYGDSTPANLGRVAGNVVATVPLTNALGAGAAAAGLTRFGNAIASGGMSTGSRLAPGASRVADMATRMAGGAVAGGVSAGAVDPESARTGALIGAALPPVAKGLGAAGSALARTVRGPEVPPNLLAAATQAQEAGYVIPPTQVRPTLRNRLLEGMSGKITTAQNASARNQEVTNRLAQQSIGADELSQEGLAAVRTRANQAYTDLGNFGAIKADDAFAKTVRDAGQRAEGFAKDFPELVNKDTEQLIESFANKSTFDSQSAIEAIKRLREGQRTIAGNPQASAETKAFGRTQGKLADALESLVERNLDQAGRPELLTAFRDARKTLARVYDIEKAMNPASGSVDARKLGNALKKGRLTEELKTVAEFGSRFPKAAQPVEGMGSLPQLSPLDWATAGGMSAATGSPLGALGLVARPAARAATLSRPVQRSLTRPGNLLSISPDENVLLPLYRGGPLLATDR